MTGAVGPGADSMALTPAVPSTGQDWCNWPIDNLILQRAGNKITFCLSTIWRTCRGPGIPATCQTLQLRREVWSWLEAVVTWLNHEHVWDVADVIPPVLAATSSPWCTRSLFWPISATAPVKRSPVIRWRSGTAIACPPSPNG